MNTEHSPLPETQVVTSISRVRGYIADGLRYWEPRRLIFNVVLGLTVVGDFVVHRPQSWTKLTVDTILSLFPARSARERLLLRRLRCRSFRPVLGPPRRMD